MLRASLLTIALFAFTGASRAATNTLRIYFIGNSVTDTVRHGELAAVIQKTVWQIVAAHPDSGVELKAKK